MRSCSVKHFGKKKAASHLPRPGAGCRRMPATAEARSCFDVHDNRSSQRRGSVTVVAMVVLVVLVGVTGQLARRVLSERRQLRQEVVHLQAEKLAEAGLDLAEVSRKQDAAWNGQTWNIPAGTIHQTNSAVVTIQMQDDICTVVARYPSNSDIPVKVTRTRKLSL